MRSSGDGKCLGDKGGVSMAMVTIGGKYGILESVGIDIRDNKVAINQITLAVKLVGLCSASKVLRRFHRVSAFLNGRRWCGL